MFHRIHSFLYGSAPASFESQYSIHEAAERLRAVTKRSVFSAFTAQALVGKVSESRVHLQRVIPFVGNSYKPFFVGHFEQTERGSVLIGRFTMHWTVKVFNTFWFGFCLLWTALATVASVLKPSDTWYFPLFGVGMLLVGTLMVQVGKWFARNDVAWLSDVIASALSVPSSAQPDRSS